MIRLRETMKGNVAAELMVSKAEQYKKKKRKRQHQRGKKSYFQSAIDEEDEQDSNKSDEHVGDRVATASEQD